MSKKAFYALCSENGIDDIEIDRGFIHPRTGEIVPWRGMVYAPKGKVFGVTGTHCNGAFGAPLSIDETPNKSHMPIDWNLAKKQLIEELSMGLVDCNDPACDICNPV